MIAVLAVLLLQAGLVNAGLASVREWQTGSVKELLLSPVPPLGVVAGKVAAGVIAADSVGCLAVAVAVAAGIMPLPGTADLALALGAMTLLGLFASALGVAIAARVRIQDRMVPISINLSFYLFFLGGGIVALIGVKIRGN
jgi:ABC-2 type transport system permease protein